MRTLKLAALTGGLLALAACDYSGDWLFAGAVDGVPGVVHLGHIDPADVTGPATIDSNVIYGEIGPTGTAEKGGVTFTFEGTGDHVCVWVDPELVFWNQSVASQRPISKWTYPDNVFDDGDLDLFAGLAAYYSGSPGEDIGSFEVRYEDSLGNPVDIELNECVIPGLNTNSGAHAGRGSPEYCDILNTQPGVNYMVLMETWSTPLDDDRLGYGVLLANGRCNTLIQTASVQDDECLILGEAVDPSANDAPGPWLGRDAVPSYPGSEDFEEKFCDPAERMSDFCGTELIEKDCSNDNTRCFCGDPANTPSGGSF